MTTSNVTDASQQDHDKTPEQIQLEIARRRSAITEDLLALSEKLSPQNLKEGAREVIRDARDEAKEVLREAKDAAIDSLVGMKDRAVETVSEKVGVIGVQARRASDVTVRFVSANAIALSLLGVGAGWLLMVLRNRRPRLQSRGEYAYDYEPYQTAERTDVERAPRSHLPESVRSVATRASEAFDAAREEVRHASHTARERAGALGERSGRTLSRGASRTREIASDHRGAVIALTVAAGLGIGLLLPISGRPRRSLRATGERLYRGARALGQGVSDHARDGISRMRGGRRSTEDDGMTLLPATSDERYAPELAVSPTLEPVTTSTADLPGAPSGVY